MAENDSTEERTEEPTAKRLEKARSEGRVARSQELSVAAMLIGTAIFLYFLGGYFVENLANELKKSINLVITLSNGPKSTYLLFNLSISIVPLKKFFKM